MPDALAAFAVEFPHSQNPVFEFFGSDVTDSSGTASPLVFVHHDDDFHWRNDMRRAGGFPAPPCSSPGDVSFIPDYCRVIFPAGVHCPLGHVRSERLLAILVFIKRHIDTETPSWLCPDIAVFQPLRRKFFVFPEWARVIFCPAVVFLADVVRRRRDDEIHTFFL